MLKVTWLVSGGAGFTLGQYLKLQPTPSNRNVEMGGDHSVGHGEGHPKDTGGPVKDQQVACVA